MLFFVDKLPSGGPGIHWYKISYLYRIKPSPPFLESGLDQIARFADAHTAENDRFVQFIRQSDAAETDRLVQSLNQSIEPRINCTDCGNCCRSLMINVTAPEADALAEHLQLSREAFDAQYLEIGFSGNMLINTIPCHFLSDNQCSIYTHRFNGCREFPAMHLPGFQQRMFTTMMHYARCPIIFNIVEQLKDTMGFARDLAILPEE